MWSALIGRPTVASTIFLFIATLFTAALPNPMRRHSKAGTNEEGKHHARIEPTVLKAADQHNARHRGRRSNRIVPYAGISVSRGRHERPADKAERHADIREKAEHAKLH